MHPETLAALGSRIAKDGLNMSDYLLTEVCPEYDIVLDNNDRANLSYIGVFAFIGFLFFSILGRLGEKFGTEKSYELCDILNLHIAAALKGYRGDILRDFPTEEIIREIASYGEQYSKFIAEGRAQSLPEAFARMIANTCNQGHRIKLIWFLAQYSAGLRDLYLNNNEALRVK